MTAWLGISIAKLLMPQDYISPLGIQPMQGKGGGGRNNPEVTEFILNW